MARVRCILPWVALIVVLAWGLGAYPLLDPDEGRNGEVGREMMAGGDYALPHLDGLPYLDKPVLFFALDAASQRLFGVTEAAARLPSLLAALATAALAAWFAGRLFGPRARPIAALAALVAPLPLAFARAVIFDSLLAFCLTLALCAFYMAVEARAAAAAGRRESDAASGRRDTNGPAERSEAAAGAIVARVEGRTDTAGGTAGTPAAPLPPGGHRGYLGWTLLAWAAIGLGVLAKGPVALAVPLLAAAPYGFMRRAARAVWHPAGVAVLALVVGPWVWLVSRQVPEFLHYALVTETWARVTTTQMNREGPIWLYIPCLIAGTLPWSVLVLAGWRRSLRPRGGPGRGWNPALLYLLLWIAVPLVMFSLSHSKRPQYILPLLPAVAILAAKVWVDAEAAAVDQPGNGDATRRTSPQAATGTDPRKGAVTNRSASVSHELAGPAGAGAAVPSGELAAGDWRAAPWRSLPGAAAVAWTWLALGVLCAAAAAYGMVAHPAALARATRLPATLTAVAVAFLIGAAVTAWGHRRGGILPWDGRASRIARPALLLGLLLPIAIMPALALPLLGEIAGRRSARDAAAAILPALPPGADVVGVRAFPPSLPFYLHRTVLVASPRGRELTSNYVLAYLHKWMTADPRQTPLRPFAWWPTALAACDKPLVFVAWADDPESRAALTAGGLPLLFVNDRMAAYGPCTPHPTRGK